MAKTVKEIEPTSLRDKHDREIDIAFPIYFKNEQYRIQHVVASYASSQKYASPILIIKPLRGGQSISVRPSEVEV